MHALPRLLAVGTAVALTSFVGCEASNRVPVEGTVTLNGSPLADATVMFAPTRANGPGPFLGTTDRDGRFVLGTIDNDRSGAAVGEYAVIIATVKSDPKEDSPAPAHEEVVPTAYRNGSRRFVVPEEGTRNISFAMKSRE
jgi:hypothetical protein